MYVCCGLALCIIWNRLLQTGAIQIADAGNGRGQFARQVATWKGMTADLALDGDSNPDVNAGHCAQPHDYSRGDAWWMVDLGYEYAIYNVTIYSERSVASEDFLGYISVRVSNSAGISEHTVSDQCALWNDDKFPKDSHQTLVCDQVMYGRFVSIQRTAGRYRYIMILCEVLIMGKRVYGLPPDDLTVSAVTADWAKIRWEKIPDVQTDLEDYLQYVIEYKQATSSGWVESQRRHSHDSSSADKYQEATLTGLTYDTVYDVRVKSYSLFESRRKETGVTEAKELKTKCKPPDQPTNLNIKREQHLNNINLIITWKAPPVYSDCRRITDARIQYQLGSAEEGEWLGGIEDLDLDDTSYTLSDLEPEEYVIRLTFNNAGGATNYNEKASKFDTDCNKCDDIVCLQEKPCQECTAGYQSVECRTVCDSGYYGVNCEVPCSEGCKEVCDSASGDCSCDQWWKGKRCSAEILPLGVGTKAPVIDTRTESAATIQWEKINNVPTGLHNHYEYAIEYRLDTSSWVEWPTRHSHDPSPDEYQEATLTGLMYDTRYYVRIKSYRMLDDDKERTGTTREVEFTTKCTAPDQPRNMTITSEGTGNKLSLTITWKAPLSYSDCRRNVDYDIKYKVVSLVEDDWIRNFDLSSGDTSVTLLNLEPAHYLVRLTVENEGGVTNYGEITTQYKTACDQCSDQVCKSGNSCRVCNAGLSLPECTQACKPSNYGINCAEDCSDGCADTCDDVSGTCSCDRWWTGKKCTLEIKALGLPTDPPTLTSKKEFSVVIEWKKIVTLPTNLIEHYQYVIEYREDPPSSWVEWPTRNSHDPLSDQYQEATLTGLTYNTVYDVRVKSYRVLDNDRDVTGVTKEKRFTKHCIAPSKPQNVSIISEEMGETVTLTITWEHPEVFGCNNLRSYLIHYRRLSPTNDSWTTDATLSSSSTSHKLELDTEDYEIKVEVTNDGNNSEYNNYVKLSYKRPDENDSGVGVPTWAIGLIASLATLGLVFLAVCMIRRLKKRRKEDCHTSDHTTTPKEHVYEEIDPYTMNTNPVNAKELRGSVSVFSPGMPENSLVMSVRTSNHSEKNGHRPVYEELQPL